MRVIDNHRSEFQSVPQGWVQRRMKTAVARYQTDKNYDPNPTVLSLTKEGIRIKTDLAFGKSTENYVGHQIVRPGQFVFTSRDFDATPILCGVSKYGGCISNLYIVFDVAKHIEPRFLEYYFWGLKYGHDFFTKLSFGMRYSFNRTQFEHIPLIHPDRGTQKAIADFLDRETARINQLMKKKQRLEELIIEKRAAETDFLLFGPVDAGSMRSSKIKFLARRISKGTTPSTLGAELVSEGVRFLRAENIWFGQITDNPQHFISEETHRLMARSALEANDVLVVIAGATTGKAAVIRQDQIPANTNQAVSYVRLWKPDLAPIVSAAIQTKRVQQDILLTSVQSAQPNLAMEDLGNLVVPYPERDHVPGLLDNLEKVEKKYRMLTNTTSRSIQRLAEFRAALITAAVTGQIDVATLGKRGETDRRLEKIEKEMAVGDGDEEPTEARA